MGQLLIWTIAVLFTVGHADAQFSFSSLSGLAQDTTNLVNNILTQVNNRINQLVSNARARTETILNSVQRIAKPLQNFSNDELFRFTKDLNEAVQDSISDIKQKIGETRSSLADTISNIFKDLSQIDPNVLRNEIDKVAENISPGLTNFVVTFNLTCSNKDDDLLDEIVVGLDEYKENEGDFNNLVKKVIDHCVIIKYNEMTDDSKDKFQDGLDRILTKLNVFLNDNGKRAFFRLAIIRKATRDFVRNIVDRIVYRIDDIESDIDDAAESI